MRRSLKEALGSNPCPECGIVDGIPEHNGLCSSCHEEHGDEFELTSNELYDETCPSCGEAHCDCDADTFDGENESEDDEFNRGSTYEGAGFDKFMDRILISESQKPLSTGDSPLRERARKHQERPLGRIKYGA